MPTSRQHHITAAAIAVLAMCVVTTAHEAIGHGSACLVLGGHITTLTSSVFRCNPSSWPIAPAGPAMNLLVGVTALIASGFIAKARTGLRLFLALVNAFSGFWESGYAVQAMATQNGDLYFAGRGLFGAPEPWWRLTGGALGVALYITTWVVTGRALLLYARTVVATTWVVATLAAVAAACLCTVGRAADIHDAFTEIGLASLPLLFIARQKRVGETVIVSRSWPAIILAVLVFALFAATLGHGIVLP